MKESFPVAFLLILIAASLFGLAGCSDLGSPPPATVPVIHAVVPASAVAGDTLTIVGSQFGNAQGTSVVRIGGVVADSIISWSETEIKVRIPSGSNTGTVVVNVSGIPSNLVTFQLQTAAAPISFSRDIVPVFLQQGCYECHGGSGGLVVHTVADLLRGGQHGAAIVPGNADGSVIVKKISSTPPFGVRMPEGGPYLDSTTIALIRTWINQGALNN